MVRNIDSDLIRGNIDTIILKTMLDGDKYGLDIIKEVEARSNGTYELKQPTLYSCLKRLENQELISSYWLDSDIGGKRHYYKLTEKGRDFFKQKQEEWSKSKFIIDNLLSNFDDDEYRLVKKDDYDKIIEGKTFNYDEQKISEALKQYDGNSSVTTNSNEGENQNLSDETDDLGINEYNNLIGDEDEENIEDNDEIEDEEDNSPVYISSDSEENEEDNIEESGETLSVNDYLLSEHEKNLLSRLRFHDDEEVNTYRGDKNSYIKHLNINEESEEEVETSDNNFDYYNSINIDENDEDNSELSEIEEDIETDNENNYEQADEENFDIAEDNEQENLEDEYIDEDHDLDNLVAVQQNLLDDNQNSDIDDFENKVNEFSKAARELQNFDSSGETTQKDEFDYDIPKPSEFVSETQEEDSDEETFEEESFENEEIEQAEEFETIADNTEEFSDILESNNYENSQNSYVEEENFEEETELNDYETEITENASSVQDDFFDELDELKDNSRSSFFVSEDSSEYEPHEVDKEIENFTQSETFSSQEDNYYQNEQNDDEVSDEYEYDTIQEEPETLTDFSAFDNIISQNADTYSQANMFSENDNHQFFVPTIEQKTETVVQNEPETESLKKAKDINALKEEFELQGIKVKEFKKYSEHEETKSYLLVNKINLIASLILLFGYMFILSAVYIIMNNTSYAQMSGFSFVYFAYAFIPFAVWAIFNIARFMANPYKKIPAKYSPGVTIFIAIIVTVQLLLITYCVNLQLGFYSFAQASYNHLLWIIPSILSFTPIVMNLIYISLFYSKNFNV